MVDCDAWRDDCRKLLILLLFFLRVFVYFVGQIGPGLRVRRKEAE